MTGFQEALLGDDKSLKVFLGKMKAFDTAFCDFMAKGTDFTLRLELRGNKGVLLHTRLYSDDIERVDGVSKARD